MMMPADDTETNGKRARSPERAPTAGSKRGRESTAASPPAQPPAASPPAQPLRPLAHLSTCGPSIQARDARHLQLRVMCQWSSRTSTDTIKTYGYPPALTGESEHAWLEEHVPAFAQRDLIVAARSSTFHLVKAILCAFGLDRAATRGFEADDNQGNLGLKRGSAIGLTDVINGADGDLPRADRRVSLPIAGIKYKPRKDGEQSTEVTATEAKKVKVGQLLDAPLSGVTIAHGGWGAHDGVATRRTEGAVRNSIHIEVELAEPACHYSFQVFLDAAGSREHVRFPAQGIVPRCFGATGGVEGGSTLDFVNEHQWYQPVLLMREPGIREVIQLNKRFRGRERSWGQMFNGMIMASGHISDFQISAMYASLAEPLFNVVQKGDGSEEELLRYPCVAHGGKSSLLALAAERQVAIARVLAPGSYYL